ARSRSDRMYRRNGRAAHGPLAGHRHPPDRAQAVRPSGVHAIGHDGSSCGGSGNAPLSNALLSVNGHSLENCCRAGGRGPADQPGSMPFALITASAAGAARNLMNALATSASLLATDTAAEK